MILPLHQMALVRTAVRTARAVSEGNMAAINHIAGQEILPGVQLAATSLPGCPRFCLQSVQIIF
jgi:hypothetical protein